MGSFSKGPVCFQVLRDGGNAGSQAVQKRQSPFQMVSAGEIKIRNEKERCSESFWHRD